MDGEEGWSASAYLGNGEASTAKGVGQMERGRMAFGFMPSLPPCGLHPWICGVLSG